MYKKGFLAALLFILIAGSALAQGIIIPEPPERHIPVPSPVITGLDITIDIIDTAAVTTVTHVFKNNWSRPVEGMFIFPLPKGASVNEFYLWIEGKKVKGELLGKEEAAKIYRDIVRRMKDPALLELAEYNLFKASIFPIPPGGERKIQLKFSGTLKSSNSLISYEYPLKGRGNGYTNPLKSFTLTMNAKTSTPITSVYSPTHSIDVSRKNEREITAGLEKSNFSVDKNFQLYLTLSKKDFGLSFAAYKEVGVDDGYFMMQLAPRAELEGQKIAAKDIIYVLDTSGSMLDDNKIGQAKRALSFGLKSLREEDRFGLISFSTEVRPFRDQLLTASSENVSAALKNLESLSAVGATNIHDALKKALEMISGSERLGYIVFLTDGLPTHVERNPDVIIKRVNEWAPDKIRIFSWGVGYDVDTRLLDSISTGHGGDSEYVKPSEDMEMKLGDFFEKISHPVLTNLELKVTGVDVNQIYPREMPDLFKGSHLLLFGRYKPGQKGEVQLSGTVEGKKKTYSFPVAITPIEDGEFIASLWATRKVGYLLEEIRLHGENKELKEEVVSLAKKYGLVTPYTSYLVTEPEMDNVDRNRRPAVVGGRRDMAMKRGGTQADTTAAPSATSGQQAVQYSESVKELKEEELVDEGSSIVKRIATKTFKLENDIWTDIEFEQGMKTITINFNSDEYFDMLALHKNMAKWLALGDNMIVVYEHVAYIIKPE